MTPTEKAINAVNARIERLQAALREADAETARRFLFESVLVTIGTGEGLTDYARTVGDYARRRHAVLKEAKVALEEQHAKSLEAGRELLEQFKAKPTDRALRKEIERIQQSMAAVQKTLRRGANALQRDLAPSLAMIDQLSITIRRFAEASDADALKRVVTTVVEQTRELYSAQQTRAATDAIDAPAWQKSAGAEIDQAAGFYDAYARTGYHVMRAIEVMTSVVSESPPTNFNDATTRANASVAERIKQIALRFTKSD